MCGFGVQILVCLCEADIPMSVGIVEPKTHPSQLNAAEFLWDLNKRTSVFVQVKNMRARTHPHPHRPHTRAHTTAPFCAICQACHWISTSNVYFDHTHSPPAAATAVCRCTASVQSSLPGNMAGRRASPSGSRSTRSPWETEESTRSTSTLPPAKSKSLRCALVLGARGRMFPLTGNLLTFLATSCVVPHSYNISPSLVPVQPKGADRKQKTDREKMEKRTPQEKEKYQPSYDTTILSEVSTSAATATNQSSSPHCYIWG